ncbi:MAG: substrate-binding domain-containing protein [Myxococcales bacterium]|nr:substrate-binding domain-containing protein [Myxococcales bacterium]
MLRWQVAVMCAVGGCTGAESGNQVEQPKPTVRIGGAASMMTGLIPALTETHASTRGTLQFEFRDPDGSEGLEALLDGEVELAATTRLPGPSEAEQAQARGWSFDDEGVRHIVGVDVTAVAVHPDNPVEALTYDQVIGLFCTHSIDDWSFLGQDERPVRPLTLAPTAGDRALFEDFFCGPRGIHASVKVATPDEIAEALASDPTVVTYVSLSRGQGKIVPLQPDPSGPPVEASQQNIIRGAYPLYRDVYLFSAGTAGGYARSFLDWIASPAGQQVVDEQRFVPLFLRPERLDEPRPLRETIHFEPGSSEPNQRSMARLDLLVQEIRERKLEHVVLEGYTDGREDNPYPLSEERANAVRVLLAEQFPEVFFEIIPRGAKNPLAPNDTPYGRLRNRRVQIYLASEEKDREDVVVKSTPGSNKDAGGE